MKTLAIAFLFLFVCGVGPSLAAPPNVVLVLADDLGYADLGCYGSKIAKTPHLDRFAAEGMRFTNCYAGHSSCSPSRAALMTGRTPMRAGIRSAIPLESPMHLRREETTIAGWLKRSGFDTAHTGKWHLNGLFNDESQPQPGHHGFDHWFSTQNNALPNHRDPVNFVRNGREVGKVAGYAGRVVADEAIRWLGADPARGRDRPFFLYVCFHEPHEPIATDPEFARQFPSEDPSFSAYYGNLAQLDDSFGRLMSALEEQGLKDNTLVWFTSDNGPAITQMHPHGSAGVLRDKKGTFWEGGIRVPGLVRWPGKIAAASVNDTPVSGVDFFPTVCELAGIEPPADRPFDGISLAPLFAGRPLERKKPLYWHSPTSGGPRVALRDGDWKIVAWQTGASPKRLPDIDEQSEREVKTAELAGFQLYHLGRDIGEKNDLAAAEPERLAELRARLEAYYGEVRAETPVWPHWKFVNREADLIVWPDYYLKKKSR